ncbi:centrosome-associated zinc finger protein CP190 [Leguminivora glycinivorella]|uniref:centrosome-associated zinc finger protein CP190 n=1 Tax=Leguminivora glycinivorella TaxID=1035111 RepID=UPI00201080D2|nr:centrosome-associated zinc finger protein CP190 [Leguminivora glycinivorella]
MSDLKQVKVDNWGIYFLQRLKHFFNRTDYCDLTLQFQDNAQLKVHRLVLSACTEYFELLERTCEMYEDCLVMPDDLQADVVVPIVNFMYTGQLEFKIELLEKLYQTSQIMNMPVLSKLLDAQRQQQVASKPPPTHSYGGLKSYAKSAMGKQRTPVASTSSSKRTFSKAFDIEVQREKSYSKATSSTSNGRAFHSPSPVHIENHVPPRKLIKGEPRPTRYELPEELDTDNIYDNSFTDISYTSTPLMVHPETTKRYSAKRSQFSSPSSSKRFGQGPSTVEIVECRKVSKEENVYDDDSMINEPDMFGRDMLPPEPSVKNSSQLFDQILDNNPGPKVTIEAKNSKQASKLDHAKIISEVLKKYPHLVKSNKNIKLKLLDTPAKTVKKRPATPQKIQKEELQLKQEPDFTYESEVLDSARAAKLIAMGAENVKGPWICLICGTPGRALHFTSYFKFRRHLVEVHNEKPVSNMCEYCGLKSLKRNYLLHHLYTKHGKKPPPQYNFPKCNLCSYIALNEGYLVKHKMTHVETRNFRCNVCSAAFNSSSMLLMHIQNTGHKYSAERRTNLQCVYCLKVFLRESNLYAHLKTNHKLEAKTDCIIDDSDEERQEEEEPMERFVDRKPIKYELPVTYDQESEDDTPYQIQQKPLGAIDIVEQPKKHRTVTSTPRQKILNSGFGAPIQSTIQPSTPQKKPKPQTIQNQFLKELSIPQIDNSNHEEIIMIGDTEYIMRDNQLIPKNSKITENDQYILSDMLHADVDQTLHTLESDTSLEFSNVHNSTEITQPDIKLNKKSTMNQPIQIVVSNEEEYKALMSSNHSIIFDDTDASKRLTVLAASHNATLDGTIDLDTTQTNDMMIIQDDFPLNVSEAVSGDNSNIVVVYSHPVDDHSKPYQLITSQALGGAQFVSTSAVLTRNYETVTTSSGVVNTQMMDNQVNWHNSIEHNINNQQLQVTQEPELQVLTNVEEVVMAPSQDEISNKLEELPEVHLLPVASKDESQVNQVSQMIEPMTCESDTQHNHHNVEQTTEIVAVEEIQATTSIPMEDNVPSQIIENSENLVTMSTEEPISETMQTESDNNIVVAQDEPQEQVSTEVEEVMERSHEPLDESTIEEEEEENIQNLTEQTEETSESQEYAEEATVTDQPSNSDGPSYAPATKEQIQNLASEWSEDEDEATAQSETIENENPKNTVTEIDNPENNSVELEESIENIQHEMEKQMTRIVAIEPIEECENPVEEIQTESLQENVTVNNAVPACPEKISSLLHDWDENDSQEEEEEKSDPTTKNDGEAINENEMVAAPEDIESNAAPIVEPPTENESQEQECPKKDDKIKSLVSDWDDEEEDGPKE